MHPLETLMKEEFDKIATGKQYSVKYDISCMIHTPTENIKALFVMDFSLLRDYINNFSDVLTITPVFGSGTITHSIMPHNESLDMTVTLRPLANVPDYVKSETENIKEYRFKAILFEDSVSVIESNQTSDTTKSQKDIEDISALKIQLVNPLQLKLRGKTFGGIIRDTDPVTAIRLLLTKYSIMGAMESQYALKGVNVERGHTSKVRDHIVVPHLTPIIRLPMVIDRLVGGIYPTGFQYYLQKDMWYLFSPFNVKAFEKSQNTLTVVNITKNKLAQLERTFRRTPTQVILLSTGEVKFKSHSFKNEINESTGTTYIDASRVMDGYGSNDGNKFIVNRQQNINEFTMSSKPDAIAKQSKAKITSSHYNERTSMAFKSGALLQFVWENGVDEIIVPGMPVRFIYMDGKEPKQVYGVVCALESSYITESVGVMQRKFSNNIIVSCFVQDIIKQSEML